MSSPLQLLFLILYGLHPCKILAFQESLTFVSFENVGLARWHTFPGLGGAPPGNGALVAVQTAVMSRL